MTKPFTKLWRGVYAAVARIPPHGLMMIGSYCESKLDIVAEACERVVKEKMIFDSF